MYDLYAFYVVPYLHTVSFQNWIADNVKCSAKEKNKIEHNHLVYGCVNRIFFFLGFGQMSTFKVHISANFCTE